jgi:hypothetical protein
MPVKGSRGEGGRRGGGKGSQDLSDRIEKAMDSFLADTLGVSHVPRPLPGGESGMKWTQLERARGIDRTYWRYEPVVTGCRRSKRAVGPAELAQAVNGRVKRAV